VINVKDMQSGDKQWFFSTVVAPIILWWFFIGRKRYGVKGMK
jgi:hypothetical protein